jgi:hypothetical protein
MTMHLNRRIGAARAAWSGTRIILRQVAPEANGVFDFIMALYHFCDGQWEQLADKALVNLNEVQKFLEFAATFLSNIGNYFVRANPVFISFALIAPFSTGFRRPEIHTRYIRRESHKASLCLILHCAVTERDQTPVISVVSK